MSVILDQSFTIRKDIFLLSIHFSALVNLIWHKSSSQTFQENPFCIQDYLLSFSLVTCKVWTDIFIKSVQWVHAFPFYKKRSYKKQPIKFFNHMKQQSIEFFKIRNVFLLTTKKWIALLLSYRKRCKKADNSKKKNCVQIRQ